MTRGNCLVWALRQWLRHGGYVIMKRADDMLLPHFMWVRELNMLPVQAYLPLERGRRGWRGALRSLWYKGEVRRSEKR